MSSTNSVNDNLKIKEIIANIEKKYGKGALMQFHNNNDIKSNIISSGSLTLDHALGIGGYPRGRIVEIYGPEATGKTTLALHAIASAQTQGLQTVYIDLEHALSANYAHNIGVNLKTLIVGQPDSGEEALSIVEALIKSGKVDVIVIDSVAALVPQAELDGNISETSVGGQARLMSKALRKLRSVVHENNCLLIFINQIRMKIGIQFGNPETTSGGRALKFYASVRLEVRLLEKITQNGEICGNKIKIKIVKNKLAAPFKIAILELIYGKGIDYVTEMIHLGVNYGVIAKAGIWYSYNNQRLGQGKAQSAIYLNKNLPLYNEIRKKIIKVLSDKEKVA